MANLIELIYKSFLRPILFLQDPEDVHDKFISIGAFLGDSPYFKYVISLLFYFHSPKLKQKILGVTFQNPIGLSAGFDKDANLVNILPSVGFAFSQVGTVTHKPYVGNPKPRLYRLPRSKALVVYYGLKNIGSEKIINKLKQHSYFEIPISISIGKTNSKKTSKTADGITDYYNCLKEFNKNKLGDFYTINISCPNTFGGEPFTTPARLNKLLLQLNKVKTSKPIFIKMPINHTWPEFEKLIKVTLKYKVNGVIIGNLNKNHNDKTIKDNIPSNIKGGISGKPTYKLSNDLISKTYQKYGDKLIIIGVGGVFSANDAYEKIKRGASLVQIITGMIYEGPQLIGQINKDLVKLLERDGYSNISEAVGTYYRNIS